MSKLYRKKTKGVSHFPIEQTVYVPTTKKGQKRISSSTRSRRVNEVRRYLANKFGGYTSVKSTGGWVMKNGKLVRERITKVTAFAKRKDFNKNKRNVLNRVSKWGKSWGQESMSYEHEGDLYIIDTKNKRKRKVRKRK